MKTARLALTWMFFVFSVFFLVNATALPWGTLLLPGAAVFPVLVGVVLMIMSLVMALHASVSVERGENPFPRGREACRVLGVFGSLVFYTIALSFLGHPLSSGICFGAILRIMGLRNWNRILIGACAAALISWYLFGVLLELHLPILPLLDL
jgi:hypothetical protein